MLKATKESFIFILDEWDSVFQFPFMREKDKQSYLDFLRNLLKDQPYVELVYMTGVLPIAKYSSGSALNMFREYSIMNDVRYSKFYGFTSEEVDFLCKEFDMDHDEIKEW